MASVGCSIYSDCVACTQDPSCGWCNSDTQYNGAYGSACKVGTVVGPEPALSSTCPSSLSFPPIPSSHASRVATVPSSTWIFNNTADQCPNALTPGTSLSFLIYIGVPVAAIGAFVLIIFCCVFRQRGSKFNEALKGKRRRERALARTGGGGEEGRRSTIFDNRDADDLRRRSTALGGYMGGGRAGSIVEAMHGTTFRPTAFMGGAELQREKEKSKRKSKRKETELEERDALREPILAGDEDN
uniref:PSI domain-containing protein n=1 Tax=Palpitomonas bilix TaxID=652834 RepID=A0A7S3LVT6_9EUKA|mmetsp:Transcript_50215/g.129255  ORF Transcript_50215/g.129255 Transcript_50215/m.129255 type:complete len:243 (+) Transcript_50215:264-992(+)|eukprot:CAMPEP_0113892112 /NCGR_PEP_ID=MMETSP0780_2-20120614/15203_1 /TAXON_ID=652834 /ORGANISM="Palpitomonas bilix" /LENGTH=242 /DNA_ID=CAMNT_0000881949 /DNA_START=201 /DNA_END=929 /DNA_ORIENTATION=+ /assembly_acc=CAM_ASM_000599